MDTQKPEWIVKVESWGMSFVAETVSTTYEAVRQWCARITKPRGTNREKLLNLAKSKLSPDEYTSFRESFISDLLGE